MQGFDASPYAALTNLINLADRHIAALGHYRSKLFVNLLDRFLHICQFIRIKRSHTAHKVAVLVGRNALHVDVSHVLECLAKFRNDAEHSD